MTQAVLLANLPKKFWNDPNDIFRVLGEDVHEKNLKRKITWHCPFNPPPLSRQLRACDQGFVKLACSTLALGPAEENRPAGVILICTVEDPAQWDRRLEGWPYMAARLAGWSRMTWQELPSCELNVISSCCYIVNVHNRPSWATSCKEGMAWYSSGSMPPLWYCCLAGQYRLPWQELLEIPAAGT